MRPILCRSSHDFTTTQVMCLRSSSRPGIRGKEAERLTRFIWNQVIQLLLAGKELEANSLLEEFDEPPLWDDPLD